MTKFNLLKTTGIALSWQNAARTMSMLLMIFCLGMLNAQTTLLPGDAAIVGYNGAGTAQTDDTFNFVTWVNLDPNTVIKFTDNGFNGAVSANAAANFRANEGFIVWTNNTGNTIQAGTVIQITQTATGINAPLTTTLGAANNGAVAPNFAASDQIFIYQGAAAGNAIDWTANTATATFNGTVIYGHTFGTVTWLITGLAAAGTSYLPTELNASTLNLPLFAGSAQSKGNYSGTRNSLTTFSAYETVVNTSSNWTTTTGTGNITLNNTPFTLAVAGATNLNISAVNGGSAASSNIPFNVSVVTLDAGNNPSPVSQDTQVTLSLGTGTGVLGGTLTGTILNGTNSVVISGVTYDTAETGVVLLVNSTSGDVLAQGDSDPFNVLAGASQLAFVNVSPFSYTGNVVGFFNVEARRPDNTVDTNYSGPISVTLTSGSGLVLGTTTKNAVAGSALFNDIIFDTPGVKELTAASGVLTSALSGNITVSTPSMIENIIPQYMQGQSGTNSNRIPTAFHVTLNGLEPNKTFRYFNLAVEAADSPTTSGAGIFIAPNAAGFTRSANTSLSTAGQYSEFITDATGSYTGWFALDPSGNSRFAGGNQVFMRISVNNGNNGTFAAVRFTTTNSITVINHTTTGFQGTALYGNSGALDKNFVCVYDNTSGTGRPIAVTFIENDGTDQTTANSNASWYQNNVNGVSGAYGMIIPNNLPTGIQRIEQRDIASAALVACPAIDADGVWPSGANTVNPSTGSTPIVITGTDAPLAESIAPTMATSSVFPLCFGGSTTLTVVNGTLAPDAQFVWYSGSCGGTLVGTGSSVVVSPTSTTDYFVRAEGSCNTTSCATIQVVVNNCPVNDFYATAQALTVGANLTVCNPVTGNLTFANSSAEAQSVAITGEDVWYTFVATQPGARIQVVSANNNILVELQDNLGNLIDSEDTQSVLGNEFLNFGGLTVGQTYYIAVRNYDSSQGTGTFTICVQAVRDSGCDYGSGPYTLCNVYKASWIAGVSYRFDFTQTTAPFQTFTRTQNSDILILSNVPGLQYGYTYSASITAIYTLTNGAGGSEVVEVPQETPCTMIVGAHPSAQLRVTDRCSTGAKFRGATIAATPWVCGVTNWVWEFQELDVMNMPVGLPIIKYRGAASEFLNLGTVPQLQYGKTYEVRTAPVFSYGDGTFGPVQTLCIVGAASIAIIDENGMTSFEERIMENSVDVAVYPNPNNGEQVNINVTNVDGGVVVVRVVDQVGRVVYSRQFTVESSLNTIISFDQPLSNGIYTLEMTNGADREVQRMVVQH